MKVRKSTNGIFLMLFIAILVAMISISLVIFHQSVVSRIQAITVQSIEEEQELYKQTIQSKFNDLFDMLESQSRFFKTDSLSDDTELKKTIMKTKGIGSFKKVSVANKKGLCTDFNGENLANIYNKPYFIDTIESGEKQISNRIELDENLEPILTLTYPLVHEGKTEALLLGTISYSVLKNLFSSSILKGQTYSYIIARDGNVILCNNPKKKTLYNVNFFSYIQNNFKDNSAQTATMKSDIIKNQSGYIFFEGTDEKLILSYAPLDINNWYIVSAIPFSYMKNRRTSIEIPVFIILVIIAFTIISFILGMFILFRFNTSIEKDNERLIIASKQAEALIFEYDIQKGTVDFSGDTKFILGTDKKNYSLDFIKNEFYKRIHPDDVSVFSHLKDSIENSTMDFSSEFRYKNFSNEYIWVHMSGSCIMKSNAESRIFIGSINNVNAQILHEQELKNIAENDRLTQLLNKMTMEQRTKKFISTEAEGKKCALFVIDLDNFKKVNDTLGHLIGDQAIKDAGKKLSLIFSEKDLIGRFGGDEFCVLMILDGELPEITVERIINEKGLSICSILYESYSEHNSTVTITASVGISRFPENGETYEELFQKADEALYQVKQSGKNNFKIC